MVRKKGITVRFDSLGGNRAGSRSRQGRAGAVREGQICSLSRGFLFFLGGRKKTRTHKSLGSPVSSPAIRLQDNLRVSEKKNRRGLPVSEPYRDPKSHPWGVAEGVPKHATTSSRRETAAKRIPGPVGVKEVSAPKNCGKAPSPPARHR